MTTASITNPLTLNKLIISEIQAKFRAEGRAVLTAFFYDLAHDNACHQWLTNRSTMSLGCGSESLEHLSVGALHARPVDGYAEGFVDDTFGSYACEFERNIHIRIEELVSAQLEILGLYICGTDVGGKDYLHFSLAEHIPTYRASHRPAGRSGTAVHAAADDDSDF